MHIEDEHELANELREVGRRATRDGFASKYVFYPDRLGVVVSQQEGESDFSNLMVVHRGKWMYAIATAVNNSPEFKAIDSPVAAYEMFLVHSTLRK